MERTCEHNEEREASRWEYSEKGAVDKVRSSVYLWDSSKCLCTAKNCTERISWHAWWSFSRWVKSTGWQFWDHKHSPWCLKILNANPLYDILAHINNRGKRLDNLFYCQSSKHVYFWPWVNIPNIVRACFSLHLFLIILVWIEKKKTKL